jgi:hypothetical protein
MIFPHVSKLRILSDSCLAIAVEVQRSNCKKINMSQLHFGLSARATDMPEGPLRIAGR